MDGRPERSTQTDQRQEVPCKTPDARSDHWQLASAALRVGSQGKTFCLAAVALSCRRVWKTLFKSLFTHCTESARHPFAGPVLAFSPARSKTSHAAGA